MELTSLDQLWVADITYIHLAEEFGYLAVVLDAFSRKLVGWAMETHLQVVLAIAQRRPTPGTLIHQSDRGMQYDCGDYTAILKAHDISHDIQASMSRVGIPKSMTRK